MIVKLVNVNFIVKLIFIIFVLGIFMPLSGLLNFFLIGISLACMVFYVSKNQIDISFLGYPKSTTLFFLTYLIYPWITFFWVENYRYFYSQVRFIILHWLVFSISYFFLVKVFTNHEKFLKIIIAIGVVYIAVSFWELLTGNHLSLSRYYGIPIPIPTGFYYNENNQTILTSMMLPIAGYFILSSKKYYQEVFYTLVIILFIAISALAGARISMMISVPFFIYILIRKRSIRVTGLLLLLFILLINYASIYKNKEYTLAKEYLKHQYKSFGAEVNNYRIGSTKIRINMIKKAISYFDESKYLGVGAGNYDYHAKQGWYAEIGWIENTHAYIFELLANYGIFVIMAFLFFVIGLSYKLIKIYKTAIGKAKILAEMNLFQIPIFLMIGFIPSSIFPIIQIWVIMGYLASYIYLNSVETKYNKIQSNV